MRFKWKGSHTLRLYSLRRIEVWSWASSENRRSPAECMFLKTLGWSDLKKRGFKKMKWNRPLLRTIHLSFRSEMYECDKFMRAGVYKGRLGGGRSIEKSPPQWNNTYLHHAVAAKIIQFDDQDRWLPFLTSFIQAHSGGLLARMDVIHIIAWIVWKVRRPPNAFLQGQDKKPRDNCASCWFCRCASFYRDLKRK